MEIISKPWGSEQILEKNQFYVVKLLKMNMGNQCSYQYHEFKTETIYVLTGCMELILEDKSLLLHSGESYTIHPYTKHRMHAKSYIEYLEASTPQLEDVVRIYDDFNRC